jgi:hypothetical protein
VGKTIPHRRSTSPLHIAAAAVLGPDRRRHLLYFGILSGNLPVLSPSLFLSAVEVAVGTWWCNLKKLGRNLVLVYLTFLQMRSVVFAYSWYFSRQSPGTLLLCQLTIEFWDPTV